MAVVYGFIVYVPQTFIDMNDWLAAEFTNIALSATYSTYASPYWLSLLTNGASTDSGFSSDWQFWYQFVKATMQIGWIIFLGEQQPRSVIITIPPLITTLWRLFVETQEITV